MNQNFEMERGDMQASAKPRKGCFYYGCFTAAIIAVIIGAATLYIGYKFKDVFDVVEQNLEDKPKVLAYEVIPPEDFGSVRTKWQEFVSRVEAGEQVEVRLTDHDINAVLQHEDNFKEIGDHLVVKIKGDVIRGDFTVPIMDKYLNGSGEFSFSFKNDDLQVHLKSLEVNNKEVDNDFFTEIMKRNLAEEWKSNPEVTEMLTKLSAIEIQGDELVLRSK